MRVELNKRVINKTLGEGFEEFILYCRAKNLRPATIKHYRGMSQIIFKFIKPDTKLKEINPHTVEQFIISLRTRTKECDISINTTLVTLRATLYYCMKLGYMDRFKIHLVKTDKKIIETYTDEELKLLLKKPDVRNCTFLEYRCWVCVNFLIATGCRAQTLCSMKIQDLDFENLLITYTHTKNRKQQIIPMSRSLKMVLIEYLSYRGGEPEDYLFVNSYGGYLRTDQLSHNLVKYNRRRGVITTGVHRFRHTFAKKWILNGGDVFKLQKILGHSSLQMVREYINMFTDDLSKGFDEVNPLEQLNHTNKKEFIDMRRRR
ncbi:tyrosine-type recombinase/integrase [Clostridium sp. WLY-B-L2]|uniref:Tyrosine-type recombinase/integrase n=1 Tax=Clostridium aromativorans TaxID=2836848 RepID=A0ABS8N3R9_9CLOT|nr:tyrosine-type recombinase/integrase [Clostridium aromativorans]MCC9294448.1 tyrosine-type recombinase/integrase [Clostridium aromativorans]